MNHMVYTFLDQRNDVIKYPNFAMKPVGKGSDCYAELPMTSFFMVAKIDYDASLVFLKLITYIIA